MTSPTVAEIDEAATNFIADTVTADAKINGVAGTVIDRHGTETNNLQQIFQDIGYRPPVDFVAGLAPADGSFTVSYLGEVYGANPSSIPFVTTAVFVASEWLKIQQYTIYDTIPDMIAGTEDPRGVGSIWNAGGFNFEEVASGGDVVNAVDVNLNALVGQSSFSPAQHGALGDGVTDDSAAMLVALDGASGILDGQGGVYKINSPINPAPPAFGKTLYIDNLTLDFSGVPDQGGSPDYLLTFAGSQGADVALSADAAAGAASVVVADASTLAVDQWVWVHSDALFEVSQGVLLGHSVKILDITGTTITFHTALLYPFIVADNAAIAPLSLGGSVKIGPNVQVIGAGQFTQCAISFDKMLSPIVMDGATFDNVDYASIRYSRTVGGYCGAFRSTKATAVGTSYGLILANGVRDLRIQGCEGSDMRHLVTGGDNDGVNIFVTVSGCYISGCRDAGLDCHGAGDYWAFIGNTVVGSTTDSGALDGIIFQGNNVEFIGNTLLNIRRHGIFHQRLSVIGDASTLVANNRFFNSGGSGVSDVAIQVSAEEADIEDVVITGNLMADGANEHNIRCLGTNGTFESVNITGNVVGKEAEASIASLLVRVNGASPIKSVNVVGNTLRANAGNCVYMQGFGALIENVNVANNNLHSAVAGVEAIRLDNVAGYVETGNLHDLEATSRVYVIDELNCTNVVLDARHNSQRLSTAPTLVIDPDENFITINETGTTTITLPDATVYPGRIINLHSTQAQLSISAAANVIPIDNATTPGTAILPAVDGAWCDLRSDGTNWMIIKAG
jgi:hypothetical protein